MNLTGLLIASTLVSVGILLGWFVTAMASADRDKGGRYTASGVWDAASMILRFLAVLCILIAIVTSSLACSGPAPAPRRYITPAPAGSVTPIGDGVILVTTGTVNRRYVVGSDGRITPFP